MLEGLGSPRAPWCCCSLLSSGTSSRSITSFLPSHFSSSASAAVSCPSSCFIALAAVAAHLTIYPDGAALLSWAWRVFSIHKSCVRAEATNPKIPLRCLGCLLWPPPAPPAPSPSPAPLTPNLGVLPSLSLLFPSLRSHHWTLPWPSCSEELPAFVFLALHFNQMQIPKALQSWCPVQMPIALAGDALCCPGRTPQPCWEGWPHGHSWLCPPLRVPSPQ